MAIEAAAIVEIAKPLFPLLVEKLVIPKLEEFGNKLKRINKELLVSKAEHYQEYFERSYNKYSIINTLVFHNSQRQLKDIYVAQTLVKENRVGSDKEAVKIARFPIELMKKYKKILITDTAGMGKSTILKRMFIDLLENSQANIGIPIYIELNRLGKERTILNEIQDELNSLSEDFDNDLLLKLIQTGGFVFFLDGYDEISIKDRNEVTIDVHNFISKAGDKNYYILTSRPESSLASFGDFQSFKIQPLTEEEAFELLEKYDLSKKKELSKSLVELLKSGQYKTIDEYLTNPLLVSLLFTAYDYKRSIPFEKHRFYGVVFEAYFEKHDSSKPIKSRTKHSGLNYDGFDSILRYVGYKCLTNIGVKFDEDTVLNTIREAKENNRNLDFYESAFLKDLTSSVPLFCMDGTDYKWVHKSLLEYFAARFIFCDAKQNQDKILSAICNSEHKEKYINMLDIYYDIDFKGFSKNITLPICERYIQFYSNNINSILFKINKDLIEKRIGSLFIHNVAFLLSSVPFSSMDLDMWKKNIKLVSRGFPDGWQVDTDVSGYLYVCECKSTKDDVIKLLFKKRPSLFTIADGLFLDIEDAVYEFKDFEEDRVYVVDMKLGEESEALYKTINEFLSGYGSWYFNYKACKEEIDRIRREISQSDNPDNLLAGI